MSEWVSEWLSEWVSEKKSEWDNQKSEFKVEKSIEKKKLNDKNTNVIRFDMSRLDKCLVEDEEIERDIEN